MHIFKHLREKIVNFIHLPDLTIFPVTASSLARRHGGVEESRANFSARAWVFVSCNRRIVGASA
jgi:hypothetical protein